MDRRQQPEFTYHPYLAGSRKIRLPMIRVIGGTVSASQGNRNQTAIVLPCSLELNFILCDSLFSECVTYYFLRALFANFGLLS